MYKQTKQIRRSYMSKRLAQKVMAAALLSTVIVSNAAPVFAYETKAESNIAYSAYATENVVILDSCGDLETASVEWQAVKGATGYNVYYKENGEADSKYKQIDTELIRQYTSYFRADVLGLKEGSYIMKVVPVFNGKEGQEKSAVTSSVNVTAHTREGFAFSKESQMGTGSGGYNDDGTIPADATILYVTADNINTIKADVISSAKGAKTTCTGLVDILAKRQKGYDKSHLIIRLSGEIKGSDIQGLNSSGYIQIKGAYNVTLEGVGEDATVNGWGLLVRNSRNVEIRNLGIMLFPDDALSLDTDNENIWIHNNDIFYGTAGSDADQAKGDGSADVKGMSNYVTVSYNHFWDSGKSSLCGMSDTEEFFVSYHHNWFDHSDSRHPRIRVGSVHIYNNYFDGNSKYGVGVTKGSSAFVEANVFRNCKLPMLSSLQGSDIAGNTKGTFSGEAGGMIKAYNNSITGGKGVVYAQTNSKQFDAYLASSRNEVVPSTYKTVSGGTTYNNFDTNSTMYKYQPDAVENVADIVTKFAGRVNGGDFTWKFTNKDDELYAVNTGLMSKLLGYKSNIVSIGGNSVAETPEVPEETPVVPDAPVEEEKPVIPEVPEVPAEDEKPVVPEVPEVPAEDEKPETPEVPVEEEKPLVPVDTETITHNFQVAGKDSSFFDIDGNLGTNKTGLSLDGSILNKYLKIESATKIAFDTEYKSTLTLILNSSFNKYIVIDGKECKAENGVVTVELEAGHHTITKGDSAQLYYMNLELQVPISSKPAAHNFTESEDESLFFTIEGNLATDKAGLSYNDLMLTKYLKIESSTNISFETDRARTLTLVLNSDFSKYIVIDGVKYKASNGIVTVELEAGNHTINKADTAKLYYMSVK